MTTYSALTSDVQRDPTILQGMQLQAWAISASDQIETVTEGPVTTVRVLP